MSVTATEYSITGYQGDEDIALYYDYGSGYFDSDVTVTFEFEFDNSVTTESNLISFLGFAHDAPVSSFDLNDVWTVTNSADYIGIGGRYYTPNYSIYVVEHKYGSAETYGAYVDIPYATYHGQTVYVKWYFDDSIGTYGRVYLYAYSDEAMTIEIDSGYYSLTEENSWEWMYTVLGWDSGADGQIDITCGNYDLFVGEPPSVSYDTPSYQGYNYIEDIYYYSLNGTVDNDAGYNQYVTTYWKKDGDSEYQSQLNVENPFNTSETFFQWIEVEPDATYYYYFEIWSALGTFTSGEDSFVAEVESGIPVMSTNFFYTTVANGDNSSAYLTGGCVFDNGEDVTAYIRYSENTTDWTDSVAYGSTINTDDSFSINVTGLKENTKYYYQSKGVNINGTGYGGIYIFEIIDWANPDLEISVSDVASTSANINITLTDDGNESQIYTYYEIRQQGSSEWYTPNVILGEPNGAYMSENQTRTITNNGLTASTGYEIRGSAFGQCYMQGFCEGIIHTDIISFTTSAVSNIPVVQLDEVGYTDTYTMYGIATVLNDGGWDCTISLEFKLATADYSHWARNVLMNPTQYCDTLDTGDSCTTFIYPVSIGKTYAVRARISNALGQFTYSNIITYTHASGSTSTDSTNTTSLVWLEPVEELLAKYGLNNTGGRLLVIIVLMILAFILIVLLPGKYYQEFVKFTIPIAMAVDSVIMILGMVVGYIPPIITGIILVVFGGVIAVFVIKIFKSQGSGVE